MADPPPFTDLSENERNQALARFYLLRPFFEEGVPLARLAQQQGLALRTARRWVRQYRQRGLAGLARKARADRGTHRRLIPELHILIEGLALQTPPPTVAYVHRQVAAVAQERGWPVPSYHGVYAIVQQLDPALVTLAHEGPKVYGERFDLLHRREASHPNAAWQADHTLLDVWLLDEAGKPARPWLTTILDDYSRGIASYVLGFQAPAAWQTALALRQAIWRKADPQWHICGIPDVFYTDHGSDFTSRHLEQVAADLGMTLVFSTPGMPRGRGRIERFFETVNQRFLCSVPGYTPPETSPAEPTLTLPTFEAQFRAFLLETYHLESHRGTGMPPQARWEAGGFLPRLPETLEELDVLLLTVAKTRRVQQDGIRFQGLRYSDLTLAAYIGEDVTIRYDPRDMAEIRVYHQTQFVCRAVCQDLAGHTIALKDIMQVRNERRRQLRTGLNERAAVVERLLAVHQPEAPLPAAAPDPPCAGPRLKRYHDD
jgi:putative transposase